MALSPERSEGLRVGGDPRSGVEAALDLAITIGSGLEVELGKGPKDFALRNDLAGPAELKLWFY